MNKFAMKTLPFSILMSSLAIAQETPKVEEIVVVGVRDTHTVITDDTMVAPADTAQLLRKMPGANINKNGELTGIAQYRGMYGDRIRVSVNGAKIAGAGPNAMDSPLHYAPVAILESLTINRGITPVSAGQETIGGFVEAKTYSGDYGLDSDFEFSGRTYLGAQTANSGTVASGFFSMANRNQIFRGFVMNEQADDLKFPDGKITPSEYARDRFDLGYSLRSGKHEFSVDFARNNTKDAGSAALPMDIRSIDSDLLRSRYVYDTADRIITVNFSASDNAHWMSNYHLRRPPQDNMMTTGAMRYRRNYATSENYGVGLKVEEFVDNGSWTYGIDRNMESHQSDISNPNASPIFIENFNDSERDTIGVFLERSISLSDRTGLNAGVRVNRVTADSDPVSANLNPMNMMQGMPFIMNSMAGILAGAFNANDLSRADINADWFARFSIEAGNDTIWYLGAARKSRSPSYQERYLWIPLEATGGLADGKTYIGNPDLNSEVAHEIEFGFDMDKSRFSFYPRAFYKKVDDFVQGVPASNMVAVNLAQMMANMGMGQPGPLEFANVEASFYGFDVESRYEISSALTLRAVASIVRAQRNDVRDDLYRISPDNIILGLDYRRDNLLVSLESVTYADQDRVSATNVEQKSDGYSLINFSGNLFVSSDLEIGFGVDNLLDTEYEDHLAGYNRAYNPDIALRDRMRGVGRNAYARVMWYF
jgi:iron complex outermembrane receptor protein